MPINLGIFASSMWMSLFFGLGTVVNIKKIREWPLIIKNSIIISQVLGAIFFLNIINENAITSRFFAVLGIVTCIVAVSLLDKCDCVEKSMLVLSRYSFPIYLLHTIFTAGFRIVLLKIGVNNYLSHVLLPRLPLTFLCWLITALMVCRLVFPVALITMARITSRRS